MIEGSEGTTQPVRHRLDVDAYYKMAETGILRYGQRVELIDGDIIDMNPIGSAHAAITNHLVQLFYEVIGKETALISVQNPLRLDDFNEPQPDVMLLQPRADNYRKNHPGAADVLLLAEISDSSLSYDRGAKLGLYARFGVPEVWIIDIASATIEIYRHPANGVYTSRDLCTSGSLSPALIPGIAIDVASLLT